MSYLLIPSMAVLEVGLRHPLDPGRMFERRGHGGWVNVSVGVSGTWCGVCIDWLGSGHSAQNHGDTNMCKHQIIMINMLVNNYL